MRYRMWLQVLAVVALASGCARGSGAPGGTQASDHAGSGSAQPYVTASSVAPGGEGNGSPVPVAAGKVEVRQTKASYRVGEVVPVTVANGLSTEVYTEDFKTVCSIVMLQRSESGATWKDIDGCQLGRPTLTVAIGPGLGITIDIDPASTHFRSGGNRIGFAAGTYRIKFGYRLDRARMGEEPLVAYSATFAVH